MSLEGRLRDLALSEVLQLLSLSRKTGTLRLHATLDAREAAIVLDEGCIVDAMEQSMVAPADEPADDRTINDRVLDMLEWRDGDFRFTPHDVPADAARVRVPTEHILMDAARRADAWARLAPQVTGPHVVPSFPDVQPRQLSLLHLSPDQWEILTRVDGARSIAHLAESLGHDVVEVATTVHGLLDAGVLMVSAPARVSGGMPTPPAELHAPAVGIETPAVDSPVPAVGTPTLAPSEPVRASAIPPVYSPTYPFGMTTDAADDDSLFDPMQVGVMTPDGMPAMAQRPSRSRTPMVSATAAPVTRNERAGPRSQGAVETSTERAPGRDAAPLLQAGDRAAIAGDFVAACQLWQQWLDLSATHARVDAVKERIALAQRLHALLQS